MNKFIPVFALLLAVSCTKKKIEELKVDEKAVPATLVLETVLSGISNARAIQDTISTIPAGLCVPMVVGTLDSANTGVTLTSDMTVTLAGTMSGSNYFEDAACAGSTITQVTIPAGEMAKLFYVKYTSLMLGTDDDITATSSDTNLAPVTKQLDLVGGDPVGFLPYFYYSGDDSIYVDATCPAYDMNIAAVSIVDAYGNSTTSASDVGIGINVSGGTATVYDENCQATNFFTIPANSGYVFFHVMDTAVGNRSISVVDLLGTLSTYSGSVAVVEADPMVMVITAPALASNGSCTAISATFADLFGNARALVQDTTFLFYDAAGAPNVGRFYVGDATCSNPMAERLGIDMNTGQTGFTIYYKSAAVGITEIILQDIGALVYIDNYFNINITP